MLGAVRQTTLLRPVRSLCKGTQNTSREARGILRGIVCGRESQKHNQRRENVGSELRSPHRCSCATFNHEARTRESQQDERGCGVSRSQSRHPAWCTTADRMAAHQKLDRRHQDLYADGLCKSDRRRVILARTLTMDFRGYVPIAVPTSANIQA